MDQDCISAAGDRDIKQALVGGHAGEQALDLRPSFHLQAVWAIIPEPPCLQQLVQVA